jgi:hypothetical protein
MSYYLFFVIAGGAVLLGLAVYMLLASMEEKQLREDLALRRLIDEERLNSRPLMPVPHSRLPTPV